MSQAQSPLVKPYWLRVGPGGLPVASERDLVAAFFDRDIDKHSFELVTTNKFGSSKCPPPYWTSDTLDDIAQAGGLLLIPGDWPEPKGGPVWQHMVPFKPEITPCDAGKAKSKQGYVYVVQPGESPPDVAMRFKQPYEEWVTLRQANYNDRGGFTRPAADSGPCTFAVWSPGKRVRIPAKWADPPPDDPIWKCIERLVPNEKKAGVVAAPMRDTQMEIVRRNFVQQSPTVTPTIKWTDKHPGGAYQNLAFWVEKILETLRAHSGLAGRVGADPSTQIKLIKWLPVKWAGPVFMIREYFAGHVDYRRFTWSAPETEFAAAGVAVKYLESICQAMSRQYNRQSGNCSVETYGYVSGPQARPYIVAVGDTPGTVAGRNGIAMEDLFRANPTLPVVTDRFGERNFYRDAFRIGQRINIPVPGTVGATSSGQTGCGRANGKVGCGCGKVGCNGACGVGCGCSKGTSGIGAPSGQQRAGTVGAWVTCSPESSVEVATNVFYRVQPTDNAGWKICAKFGKPGSAHAQLRDANPNKPMSRDNAEGAPTGGACLLTLKAGDYLNIPLDWFMQPRQAWKDAVPYLYSYDPATEQYTKIPNVGFCPPGTTRNTTTGECELGGGGGGTIPGVPPVNGKCPTGTVQYTDGLCYAPGTAPPGITVVIPGIPPTNGVCPPGMMKYSDGLCYAPGTAPPGITPVGLDTKKKAEEEGWPTWAWALLGLGAVAGVAGVAYYVRKQREEEAGGAPVEEEPVVEEVIADEEELATT